MTALNGNGDGKGLIFPPGRGGYTIPQIQQALGIFNTGLARLYRNPDEAYINDRTAAESMLNDLTIAEPLNSRIMATALLPWHVQAEDARDAEQVHVAKVIQGILEECPEFVKLRSSLLWGIWYGSAGVEVRYKFDYRRGFKRLVIDQFQPIHGDSIRWRWDEPGKIGIMVYASRLAGEGTKDIPWISSDLGPVHLLDDSEREQFVIHKHLLAMGSYFDPQKAGMSQGVGIRNYVYWFWRQKQEMLAMLSEYLERWGLGATIARYPLGNPEFQQQAQAIAQNIDFSQVITWPVSPSGEETGGLERIVPDTNGVQNYRAMIEDYYSKFIRQFISGASVGDTGDVTIIGQDDSHENNFSRLIRFDAINLADTLTNQLVKVIQRWTFPESYNRFCCKFVINVDRPDPAGFMQAAKLFWDMGGTLSESQVRNELRLSEPMPGEKALTQPQPAPGPTNPFSGEEPNAKEQLPQPGRGEGEWTEQEGPEGGEQLVNDETGAVRYSKDDVEQYVADDYPMEDWHGLPLWDSTQFSPGADGGQPTWGRRRDGRIKNFGGTPPKKLPANRPKNILSDEQEDKLWQGKVELGRMLGKRGIKVDRFEADDVEEYKKEDWTRIEDGPKGGKRWKNKISGKISYKDPSGSKAKPKSEAPAKKKPNHEQTIKEATQAFTDKDAEALDRINQKLRSAKGKRGELAITGLQAIARAIGLKGVSRMPKDRLIDALVDKLGGAKAEAPQADFERRIKNIKTKEEQSGVPFLDRVATQILAYRDDEDFKQAMMDMDSQSPTTRGKAAKTITRKIAETVEGIRNGENPDEPSDELEAALKAVSEHGKLSPAEAIDLALERGKLDKIAPPKREKPPIDWENLELERRGPTKAEPKTPKVRTYLDKLDKPAKVRERHIRQVERKTKTPFMARVVNRLISDKILSPEARQAFQRIEEKVQRSGKPVEKLPDAEKRFYKDYVAGQRYQALQTKMLRANNAGSVYVPRGDEASFLKDYRRAILSRLAFEDFLTTDANGISDILADLSNKGYGSLNYEELIKKARNTNPYRQSETFSKEDK